MNSHLGYSDSQCAGQPRPKIVILAGPTASGKTEIGVRLAETFHGEVVSADSIQIRRFMDIGSAKPDRGLRRRVPHHLIDIRDPDEDFSAGDYVREARTVIRDLLEKGKTPIVAGGTGLYIRCLLGGIVDVPGSDPTFRHGLEQEERDKGPGTLFKRLQEIDPDAASALTCENLGRIVRALELFQITGILPSRMRREHAFHDRPYVSLYLCLSPERLALYERIDNRVDSMIKKGLLEEVTHLYAMGYARDLKSMQSLGYRHAGFVLAGEMAPDEAVRLMKRDTRRYAKRQFTWFRSEPEVKWCDPDDVEGIVLMVAHFLGR